MSDFIDLLIQIHSFDQETTTMRLFWEIVALAIRRQLTYRAAIWAGLATNVFFGLLPRLCHDRSLRSA